MGLCLRSLRQAWGTISSSPETQLNGLQSLSSSSLLSTSFSSNLILEILSSQLPGHVAWCASLILFSFLQDLLWTSLQFWRKLCESCGTRCVLPHCCFENVKWQSYNLHWESWQCGCEISNEVSLVDTIDKSTCSVGNCIKPIPLIVWGHGWIRLIDLWSDPKLLACVEKYGWGIWGMCSWCSDNARSSVQDCRAPIDRSCEWSCPPFAHPSTTSCTTHTTRRTWSLWVCLINDLCVKVIKQLGKYEKSCNHVDLYTSFFWSLFLCVHVVWRHLCIKLLVQLVNLKLHFLNLAFEPGVYICKPSYKS